MFDKSNQESNKDGVEDIFAGGGGPKIPTPAPRPSGPPPSPLRPVNPITAPPAAPSPSGPPALNEFETKAGIRPKPFIIGGVIILILILVGVGIWFFFLRTPATPIDTGVIPEEEVLDEQPGIEIIEPETETEDVVETVSEPPADVVPVDTDGDGLTDDEEAEIGSNPLLVDSDRDGLSDNQEVGVYRTDPTNPDTDGDGYDDGGEVDKGYNPNGPGRLFQVPTQ